MKSLILLALFGAFMVGTESKFIFFDEFEVKNPDSLKEQNELDILRKVSNTRKIIFRKLIKEQDMLNTDHLTEEQKYEINEAIEVNFLKLLKRVYTITSRSRYGRRK